MIISTMHYFIRSLKSSISRFPGEKNRQNFLLLFSLLYLLYIENINKQVMKIFG